MAAKPKLVSKAPPAVEEEPDCPDCPACPPVGAPAWMATFADMATLLMAFFVLILAFANFDEVSFKKLAGSMRDAFGVQLIQPLSNPKSATIIEMNFKPTSSPLSEEDNPDAPAGDPNEGNSSSDQTKNPLEQAAEALTRAVRQAMADGELTVESDQGTVTVKLPPGSGEKDAQALADAIARAAGTQAQEKPSVAEQSAEAQKQLPEVGGPGGEKPGGGSEGESQNFRAGIAEARLQVALRQEIAQGLVAVERRDDKVFVTVGAGGAFRSGSDDLTAQAEEIMDRLGAATEGKDAQISVTGHTDNVPISGGRFRDNWDLAAARASSVVRALEDRGAASMDQMTAISKGESAPVASNDTDDGREKNRRIEIEITFPGTGSAP